MSATLDRHRTKVGKDRKRKDKLLTEAREMWAKATTATDKAAILDALMEATA